MARGFEQAPFGVAVRRRSIVEFLDDVVGTVLDERDALDGVEVELQRERTAARAGDGLVSVTDGVDVRVRLAHGPELRMVLLDQVAGAIVEKRSRLRLSATGGLG